MDTSHSLDTVARGVRAKYAQLLPLRASERGTRWEGRRSSQRVIWMAVMANLSQRQSMRWDTLRAGFASVGGGDIEDARFRLHCIGRARVARLRAGTRPAGAARGS